MNNLISYAGTYMRIRLRAGSSILLLLFDILRRKKINEKCTDNACWMIIKILYKIHVTLVRLVYAFSGFLLGYRL